MKFLNNKKYELGYHNGITHYMLYRDNQFFLMAGNEFIFQAGFKKIGILYKYGNPYISKVVSKAHGEIVLILLYSNNEAGIYDLFNYKWIIERFKFSTFRLIDKIENSSFEQVDVQMPAWMEDDFENQSWKLEPRLEERKTIDHIYEIVNKHPYSLVLYSLERGEIYGPLTSEPEFLECGYIIDKKIYHEFNGFEIDLSQFEEEMSTGVQLPIFHNNSNDEYWVLYNEKDGGMFKLEPKPNSPYFLTCEFGDVPNKIYYDKINNIVSIEYYSEREYEYTAEDTWDAMTDGQYGDYQGIDLD